MKVNDLKSYREKDTKKLIGEITELEKKITDLNLQAQVNKVKNLHESRNLRKKIATLKTIICEKQVLERAKNV